MESITKPDQPFLFEALIPPSVDKITKKIPDADAPVALRKFYFKVKAQRN